MLHFRSVAVLFLSLSVSSALADAQQVTLSRIEFSGDTVHSPQELLAVSGLKPGPSTQQAVQDAAQRLNDTGLFDEVNFSSQGTVLTYTLKPAAGSTMYPGRFSNFVWWDDTALDAALRKQVPLYRVSELPLTGTVHDAVIEALKNLVAQKGIPTPAVIAVPVASRPGGKPDSLAFQISLPSVRVHSLSLTGSSPAMEPKLKVPLAALTGEPWDEIAFPGLIDSPHRGDVP